MLNEDKAIRECRFPDDVLIVDSEHFLLNVTESKIPWSMYGGFAPIELQNIVSIWQFYDNHPLSGSDYTMNNYDEQGGETWQRTL